MNHLADRHYWEAYSQLPETVQRRADEKFALLKKNPNHSSLHFKPVGPYWSARISRGYRALAIRDGDDLVWFWIGSHADYDRLLER